MLKIQLAIAMEKLVEKGQMNFAKRLYASLKKMYAILNEMEKISDAEILQLKTERIIIYLKEVEDIMLACKVGINFPDADKVLSLIQEITPDFGKEVFNYDMFGKS